MTGCVLIVPHKGGEKESAALQVTKVGKTKKRLKRGK
jgi:hypothetical protein